jgi:hypothetical protein
MTAIEKACLEFCIELLNQRHRSHKYESALVCAMAVLGQGEAGWRDPESYPPILSRVIKIARFMVVQKALWMDPIPQGAATVVNTKLGFSPEQFSSRGLGVGTNKTVWGTIVAPDGVGYISNFSRLLVG